METERITDEQAKELETAILEFARAKKITDFAARGLIFMLQESQNLTRPVAMKFDPDTQLGKGREVAYADHDVCQSSSAADKSINNLIRRMNSPFYFYGYHGSNGLGASLVTRSESQREEILTFTVEQVAHLEV